MKIKVGDLFPDFKLEDEKGTSFQLRTSLKKNYLVIFFYPKDDSPGCTMQACHFRDNYSIFNNLNCDIIGISSDSVNKHKEFQNKYSLPFTLLSDSSSELRRSLELPKDFFGLTLGRITFLINSKREILFIFRSSLNMKAHINAVLKVLKSTN